MPTRRPNIQGCFTDFAYDAEHHMIHSNRQKPESVDLVYVDFVGVAMPDSMLSLKRVIRLSEPLLPKQPPDTI